MSKNVEPMWTGKKRHAAFHRAARLEKKGCKKAVSTFKEVRKLMLQKKRV